MNTIKCCTCGLINYAGEVECRRCGAIFVTSRRGSAKKRRFISRELLYMLLAIALIGGAVDYFYVGFTNSMSEVNANEAKRRGTNTISPGTQLSRTQADQQRVEPYKNAIQNSDGLAASERHNAETEKLMHQTTTGETPQ